MKTGKFKKITAIIIGISLMNSALIQGSSMLAPVSTADHLTAVHIASDLQSEKHIPSARTETNKPESHTVSFSLAHHAIAFISVTLFSVLFWIIKPVFTLMAYGEPDMHAPTHLSISLLVWVLWGGSIGDSLASGIICRYTAPPDEIVFPNASKPIKLSDLIDSIPEEVDRKSLRRIQRIAENQQVGVFFAHQKKLKKFSNAEADPTKRSIVLPLWIITKPLPQFFKTTRFAPFRIIRQHLFSLFRAHHLDIILAHELKRLDNVTVFGTLFWRPISLISIWVSRLFRIINIAKIEIWLTGFCNQVKRTRYAVTYVHTADTPHSLRTSWDDDHAVREKISEEQNRLIQLLSEDNLAGYSHLLVKTFETMGFRDQAIEMVADKEKNARFVLALLFDDMTQLLEKEVRRRTITKGDMRQIIKEIKARDIKKQLLNQLEKYDSLAVKGDPDRTVLNVEQEKEFYRFHVRSIIRVQEQRASECIENNKPAEAKLILQSTTMLKMIEPSIIELIETKQLKARVIISKLLNTQYILSVIDEGRIHELPAVFCEMVLIVSGAKPMPKGSAGFRQFENYKEAVESMQYVCASLTQPKCFLENDMPHTTSHQKKDTIKSQTDRFNSVYSTVMKEYRKQTPENIPDPFSIESLLERVKEGVLQRIQNDYEYPDFAVDQECIAIAQTIDEHRKKQTGLTLQQAFTELHNLFQNNITPALCIGLKRRPKPREEFRDKESLALVVKNMSYPLLFDQLQMYPNINVILSQSGTIASHWSISAGNLDIMAITAAKGELDAIESGQEIYVNGRKGIAVVNPNVVTRQWFKREEKDETALYHFSDRFVNRDVSTGDWFSPLIIDGSTGSDAEILEFAGFQSEEREKTTNQIHETEHDRIKKLLNAQLEDRRKTDSIGLLRTELLIRQIDFDPMIKKAKKKIDNEGLDSDELRDKLNNNLKTYKDELKSKLRLTLTHMPGTVTVRFLDHQDDKPVKGIPPSRFRGFEYITKDIIGIEILRAQMEAIIEIFDELSGDSAPQNAGRLQIMFPLISTGEDAAQAVDLWDTIRGKKKNKINPTDEIKVGFMLETTECLKDENLKKIFALADFLPIGSNDLTNDTFPDA
ncbi:MAG: hypothetical protein GF384_06020, partial [Elusimicrobia bacterium]|nr:hypothetical protein [Elusimicrobiota bacterium]MBD3412305.1 hypothetical protein [Elusimicrobiota bacterium]